VLSRTIEDFNVRGDAMLYLSECSGKAIAAGTRDNVIARVSARQVFTAPGAAVVVIDFVPHIALHILILPGMLHAAPLG
jgi:hypothetical protein